MKAFAEKKRVGRAPKKYRMRILFFVDKPEIVWYNLSANKPKQDQP